MLPSTVLDMTKLTPLDAIDHHNLRLADGRTVVVESVRLEEHLVEVRTGEPLVSEPCLVVRLAYSKDGPVIVDPESLHLSGIQVGGYEHRLYTRAHKYVGLFWPVGRDQIAKLRSLGLISLARFRSEAEKRDHRVEIGTLPPPQIGGMIPKPSDVLIKRD